jgi:hypothetical protein
MIAVTILAFALLPLFLFQKTGSRVVTGTRDIATAAFLASQAMESLRSWPYDRLAEEDTQGMNAAMAGPVAERVFNAPDASEIEVGKTKFHREVEVTPLAQGSADPDLKLVRVRVEWKRKKTPLAYEVTSVVVPGDK